MRELSKNVNKRKSRMSTDSTKKDNQVDLLNQHYYQKNYVIS